MIQDAVDMVRRGVVRVRYGDGDPKTVQFTADEETVELTATEAAIVFLCIATGHDIYVHIEDNVVVPRTQMG